MSIPAPFFLVDISDIFYFFRLGGGEGGVRGDRGGGQFFIEIPPGVGVSELRGIGEGNFFFFGAEIPTKSFSGEEKEHKDELVWSTSAAKIITKKID